MIESLFTSQRYVKKKGSQEQTCEPTLTKPITKMTLRPFSLHMFIVYTKSLPNCSEKLKKK